MYGLECIRWLNSASSGLWTEGTGQEDPGRGPSFFICLHFLYGTSKHSKIENPCPRIFLWSPRMKRQLLTLWCKPPKMTDFPLSYLTRLQKNHAFWGGQARSLKQESVLNRRTQKEPLAGHEVVLGAKWPAHGKSPEATGHAYYGRMLVVLWQPFKKFMCLYAFRKRVLIGHTPISSVSRGRWITKWKVFSALGIEARRAPRQCGVCWQFSVWLLCLC